ncbi:MAG: hypothetical protein VKM98_10490, partial [Cyanobacteriota bacterium]|nr:hypothetical protein [Cyanobacteriota bacterium]
MEQLLLWDEQGFGDAIQALRWVSHAANRCQRLTLLLRPSLLLLAQQRLALPAHVAIQSLVDQPNPWLAHRPHLPLMSLPLALSELGRAPVTPAQPLFRCRRRRLGSPARIGLVWAAGRKPEPEPDRHARSRSLPLRHLLQIIQDGVGQRPLRLVSLQVGPDAIEADQRDLPWAVEDPGPLNTWEDTAQQLEKLDGLISVDTAVAHLAGSMGV